MVIPTPQFHGDWQGSALVCELRVTLDSPPATTVVGAMSNRLPMHCAIQANGEPGQFSRPPSRAASSLPGGNLPVPPKPLDPGVALGHPDAACIWPLRRHRQKRKVPASINGQIVSAKRGLTVGLDLETFLTIRYSRVDDWDQPVIALRLPVCDGPAPELSDSEAVCLGLAAPWRSGVSSTTEWGCLRYVREHLRPRFPRLISQNAFNQRLRRLWGGVTPHLPVGAGVWLQQAVAHQWMRSAGRWRTGRGSSTRAGWPILPALAKAAMTATSLACTCGSSAAPRGWRPVGSWGPATFKAAGWPKGC